LLVALLLVSSLPAFALPLAEELEYYCADNIVVFEGRIPQGNIMESAPVFFSAVPDDYDEDGIPIFYISVSPDEWERTFLFHPFYQNLTAHEEAHFVLTYAGGAVPFSNWCSRCGLRQQILERRWVIGATRTRNCPQSTVLGTTSFFSDILVGRTWESRESCNACGWATHPWGGQWWIDFNNQHLWSWTIECVNNAMRGTVNVIVGGAWSRHTPHQAVSFRPNAHAIVHGHNCRAECGRLCT